MTFWLGVLSTVVVEAIGGAVLWRALKRDEARTLPTESADVVTFRQVVDECARTPEFVEQFDRLTGHHLSTLTKRTSLDAMIDEATGRDRLAMLGFVVFVDEMVWSRLPEEIKAPEGGKVAAAPHGEPPACRQAKRDDGVTDHPGAGLRAKGGV